MSKFKLVKYGVVEVDPPPDPEGYFVASDGDDFDTGLWGHPWQTIDAVNAASLGPGDAVYLNRGDTFDGRLIPNNYGTDGHPIIYGAYGTGPLPIVNGSSSSALYINNSTYHHLRYENIDFAGATGAQVQTVRCYTHDVYFYNCIMRDSASWIGFSAWSTTGATTYNITLDTCTFTGNYKSGLFIGSDTGAYGPHDVEIKNCTSYSNGNDAYADHGFYIKFGVMLHDSIAYGNSSAGIKVNCETVHNSEFAPTVYNCTSYSNAVGIYVAHEAAHIYNNLFYSNTDFNMQFDGDGDNCLIYFNTLVNSTDATYRAISINGNISTGNIIMCNLFIQDSAVVTKSIILCASTSTIEQAAGNNTWDYNVYYWSASSSGPIIYDGGAVATKTFAQWQAAGAEAHGILITDLPDFITRYTDLHISDGGNLEGCGIAIDGYGVDKDGVARQSPPSPGCYEVAP